MQPNESIVVAAGTPIFADYLAAQRTHLRAYRFRTILVYLMIGSMIGVIAFANWRKSKNFVHLFIPGVAVVAFSARPLLNRWWWRRQWERDLKDKLPVRYDFDEAGVVAEALDSTSAMKWEAFKGVRAGNGVILLYIAKDMFFIIPKRFFETEEAFRKANGLIMQRVAAKAHGFPVVTR